MTQKVLTDMKNDNGEVIPRGQHAYAGKTQVSMFTFVTNCWVCFTEVILAVKLKISLEKNVQ